MYPCMRKYMAKTTLNNRYMTLHVRDANQLQFSIQLVIMNNVFPVLKVPHILCLNTMPWRLV